MSLRAVVVNGLVLLGIGAVFVIGAVDAPDAVVAGPGAAGLAALEADAARAPSAASVVRLADAYLERGQPGLASALLERLPSPLRDRPEVEQVYARALFGRGHAREALAVARDAEVDCGEGSACPAWLVAKAARQAAFFEQVVAAGIDDPYADPDATKAAYARSEREVRLVAMR